MKELIRELVNLADVLEDLHYNLDLRNHQRFPFFIENKLYEVLFSQYMIMVSVKKRFSNPESNSKIGLMFGLWQLTNVKSLEVYDGLYRYDYNTRYDCLNSLECFNTSVSQSEPTCAPIILDISNIDQDIQFQLSTLFPDGYDKVLNYMKEIYPSELMGTSFNGVVISTEFTIDEVQRLIEVLTKLGSIHAF